MQDPTAAPPVVVVASSTTVFVPIKRQENHVFHLSETLPMELAGIMNPDEYRTQIVEPLNAIYNSSQYPALSKKAMTFLIVAICLVLLFPLFIVFIIIFIRYNNKSFDEVTRCVKDADAKLEEISRTYLSRGFAFSTETNRLFAPGDSYTYKLKIVYNPAAAAGAVASPSVPVAYPTAP